MPNVRDLVCGQGGTPLHDQDWQTEDPWEVTAVIPELGEAVEGVHHAWLGVVALDREVKQLLAMLNLPDRLGGVQYFHHRICLGLQVHKLLQRWKSQNKNRKSTEVVNEEKYKNQKNKLQKPVKNIHTWLWQTYKKIKICSERKIMEKLNFMSLTWKSRHYITPRSTLSRPSRNSAISSMCHWVNLFDFNLMSSSQQLRSACLLALFS